MEIAKLFNDYFIKSIEEIVSSIDTDNTSLRNFNSTDCRFESYSLIDMHALGKIILKIKAIL